MGAKFEFHQKFFQNIKTYSGGRRQTDMDNPAEYGFIRNRIVPLGLKRIVI